jgi:hypothetical protein
MVELGRHSVSGWIIAPSVLVPSDGVFGRFDLVALCGCHTLNVCLFVCIQGNQGLPHVGSKRLSTGACSTSIDCALAYPILHTKSDWCTQFLADV